MLFPYWSTDAFSETDAEEMDGFNSGIFVFALTFSPVGATTFKVYSTPGESGNSLTGKAYQKYSWSNSKVSVIPFPEMVTSKSEGGSFPLLDELNTGFDHEIVARINSTESEMKHETESLGGVSGKLMLASFLHEKKIIKKERKNRSFFIY
jgi:hypothetical protein